MSTMTALFIILALLLILIGGKMGLEAIVSLVFNFFWLFLTITLIAWGFSPLIVVTITGVIILAMTIFLSDDNDQVTRVAFATGVVIMLMLIAIIVPVEHFATVQGFANEDSDALEGLSLNIGINFLQITIVATILSTLGAIAEAAMAVAAGMQELISDSPDIPTSKLFGHGMHIGQQIISTAINTLFFGFMGSFLGLSIWFIRLNYGFADMINAKIFVSEFLLLIFSMIAVILAVPCTAWFMKLDLQRQSKSKV
ncbi:YibE/F family protein [Periweissella fabalis]|uniref:YibE/F family protein n=1 Tax=Periweissella fabalis TaxID=1070421 RepID=A0A7X6N1Y3_9LACO|nr:YibE/F family protein [Periweissella fabalis]MCM0598618.1 YibE/F family protein [Periweissella fabalis]NKZ24271.1 YibE/F family protein [Periweissella fabalis]